MSKKSTSSEPQLKVVARPSLYIQDVPQSSAEKSASILGSLEPDQLASKVSRRSVMWVLSISLCISLFAWAYANSLFSRPLAVPAWVETAFNISNPSKPAMTPSVPITQPTVANVEQLAALPVLVEESRPAVIVVETVPVVADAASAKPETPEKPVKIDMELAKVKSIEEMLKAAPVAEQKPTSQKQPQPTAAPAKPIVVARRETKVVESRIEAKQVKAEAAKNAKDEDVDLIAALLARVSRQDLAAKEAKNKTAAVKPSSSTVAAKKKKTAEPNRDVVAQNVEESTDSLLKRCKSLGFFEGELCRVRICSQRWGVDPACPMAESAAGMPNVN